MDVSGNDERDPTLTEAWRAHAREAPPAALDEKILAAAHRAVASGPRKAGAQATRPQRWWMPLAAAAAIGAVALGVIQLMPQEQAIDTTSSSAPAPAAPPAAPPPAAVPERAAAVEKNRSEAQPAAQPAPAPKVLEAPKLNPPRAPEPFPAAPMQQKTEAVGDKAARSEMKRDAPAAGAPAKPAAAPPPPPAPAASSDATADARKDMSAERQVAAAPVPAAAPAPAMRAQIQAPASAAAGALSKNTASLNEEARARARDPDAWIVRIRKLRDESRTADALRELKEFRELVPDAEKRLPPDLRELK